MSQRTLDKISNLSQDDSFDQVRTVNQTRDGILQKKKGLIKGLTNFYLATVYCWIVCPLIGYYLDIKSVDKIERLFTYRQSMYRRILTIFDISYQNRKLEMISSGWISSKRPPEELHELSISRLASDSDKLTHFEKQSMTGFLLMNSSEPFSSRSYKYPFYYKLKSGQVSYIESSYHDGVFQYLASASVIKNAEVGELARNLDERLPLTAERIQFDRISYNSMNSLRTGSEEIIRDFNFFSQRAVYEHTIHTYYTLVAGIIIFAVSFVGGNLFLVKILDNEGDVLHVFALIERHELEDLVFDLEEFMDLYLRDFLSAENSDYEFRGSHDECGASEPEKVDWIEEGGEEGNVDEDYKIKHLAQQRAEIMVRMGQKGWGNEKGGIPRTQKSRKQQSLKEDSVKSKNDSEGRQRRQSTLIDRKKSSTVLMVNQSQQFSKKAKGIHNSLENSSKKIGVNGQRSGKQKAKTQIEDISKSSQATTKSSKFKRGTKAAKMKTVGMASKGGQSSTQKPSKNIKGSDLGVERTGDRLRPTKFWVKTKPKKLTKKLKISKKFRLFTNFDGKKDRGEAKEKGKDDHSVSREDEFRHEEFLARRVKKLKKKKRRTCNGLSLVAVGFCALFGTLITIGLILLKYTSNSSLLFVDKNFLKLGSAPVYLKIIFNLVIESLSEQENPLLVKGNPKN